MDYFPFREIESHDHSPQVQMLSYLPIEAGAPRGECWVSTTTGQHNRESGPRIALRRFGDCECWMVEMGMST
jgi:hypothetical protein